jgi:hypothetical protein
MHRPTRSACHNIVHQQLHQEKYPNPAIELPQLLDPASDTSRRSTGPYSTIFLSNRLGGGARDLFAILRRVAGTEGASAPPPAPRWRDREFSPDCSIRRSYQNPETTDTCPVVTAPCRHRDRVREGAPTGSIRGSETVSSGDVARPVEVAQPRTQDARTSGSFVV